MMFDSKSHKNLNETLRLLTIICDKGYEIFLTEFALNVMYNYFL